MNTAVRRMVGSTLWAAAAFSAASACASSTSGPGLAKVPAPAQAVAPPSDGSAELQKLEKAIGLARCQRNEQCRTVPIGTMACGGPEGYLAWSTTDSPLQQVQSLAAAHAQVRQAWHEHTGIASVCVIRPDPGAHCQRVAAASGSRAFGRCVLSAPAGKPDLR